MTPTFSLTFQRHHRFPGSLDFQWMSLRHLTTFFDKYPWAWIYLQYRLLDLQPMPESR
jgi:hypothetical protein